MAGNLIVTRSVVGKHTPGPWRPMYDAVTQSWEIDQGYPNGIGAGIRIRKTDSQSINEQDATAHLIAAAPSLYEAIWSIAHIQATESMSRAEALRSCIAIAQAALTGMYWPQNTGGAE